MTSSLRRWNIRDARARFSELIRRVRSEGPQKLTVHGKPAVVILDADEYDRLVSQAPNMPLVAFLEGLRIDELNIERSADSHESQLAPE